MRTESLRLLASFFVRFLRKGGAIAYAACCVPRRAAAACGCPGSASARRQPFGVSRRVGAVAALCSRRAPVSVLPKCGMGSGAPVASSRRELLRGRLGPAWTRTRDASTAPGAPRFAPRAPESGCCSALAPPVSGCVVRERWILFGKCVFARYGLVCRALILQASVTRSLASHARHQKTHEFTTSTRQRHLLQSKKPLHSRATPASILSNACKQ